MGPLCCTLSGRHTPCNLAATKANILLQFKTFSFPFYCLSVQFQFACDSIGLFKAHKQQFCEIQFCKEEDEGPKNVEI